MAARKWGQGRWGKGFPAGVVVVVVVGAGLKQKPYLLLNLELGRIYLPLARQSSSEPKA